MAIVSSTKDVIPLGGGRYRMIEKHTDSQGVVHEQRSIYTEGQDPDALLAQGAERMAISLALTEFEQEVG